MTSAHVDELPLRDLARVELARLTHGCLGAACRRFIAAHEWRHAERVLEELDRRGVDADHELRYELVTYLLDGKQLALARPHIAKLPAQLAKDFALEVA